MPNRPSKGFRVPSKVVDLEMPEEYAGAVVRAKTNVSMKQLWDLTDKMESEDPGQAFAGIRDFGDTILESWNLEDSEGEPLPPNGEGILQVDFIFARSLIEAWMQAVTTVAAPLGQPSNNGSSSRGPSMPMDPSSLGLESLSTPS